ncbi:MAG: DUF928 domain-containing protein [Phormidesmis sp.]
MTLATTVGLTSISVVANAQVRWTPDPERGRASSSMSGGRRGTPFAACALDHGKPDPAITLLVPDGSVNLTTEALPTLSWFLESDQVVEMEFVLSSPESASAIYTQQIRSAAGLVEVALPESAALEPEIPYRWTVFVECDGGEYSIHARSFGQRTEAAMTGASLEASPLELASSYAAQGIWYDALNTLVSAYREESEMDTLLEIRSLLRQADAEVPLDLSLAAES